MQKKPQNDIRRYHPSIPEQSILAPNLKKYFSYPERSPDRGRIASEVSAQLREYSNHWTNRAVRLWFNNNRHTITDQNQDKTCEMDETQDEVVPSRKEGSFVSLHLVNQNTSKISPMFMIEGYETLPALSPKKIGQESSASVSEQIQKLEDEIIWLNTGDQKLETFCTNYDQICSSIPEIIPSIVTSNMVKFPPITGSPSPISIMDLMNKHDPDSTGTDKSSIWGQKNFVIHQIEKFERSRIIDGFAGYVKSPLPHRSFLYTEHPEFNVSWREIPISLKKESTDLLLHKDGAYIISPSELLYRSYDPSKEEVILDLPHQDCVTIDKFSNGVIIGSKSSNDLLFVDNEFSTNFQTLPIDGGVICSRVSNDSLYCAIDDSTIMREFSLDGRLNRVFVGHRSKVNCLHILSDNVILSAAADGLKIWDSREKRSIAALIAENATPLCIGGCGGYAIAGFSDRRIRCLDIRHKQAKPAAGAYLKFLSPVSVNYNPTLDTLALFTQPESDHYWTESPDPMHGLQLLTPFVKK